MEMQRQLTKQLKRLNATIKRLVAKSNDFAELRHLLRSGQVQLAIYVMPVIPPASAQFQVGGGMAAEELRAELTNEDRAFLKQAGILFEESTGV